MYAPPDLPSYLSDTFDLKPVVGVPSDNEVKLIHAAIRALDEVANRKYPVLGVHPCTSP
jgi:hypothetical protein